MALPNRLHTAVYSFEGGEMKLQANMDALEALKEDVGQDPILYIGSALQFEQPGECADHFKNIFYHLQVVDKDQPRESKASIYAWLFGEFEAFFKEDNILKLGAVLAKVMGKDISAEIIAFQDSKSAKVDIKKK